MQNQENILVRAALGWRRLGRREERKVLRRLSFLHLLCHVIAPLGRGLFFILYYVQTSRFNIILWYFHGFKIPKRLA